jgi:hypothetical protein
VEVREDRIKGDGSRPGVEWSGPVRSKDSHAPPSSGGEGESRVETVHVFIASFDIEPDAVRAFCCVGAVQSDSEQGCPAGMSSSGFQLGGEAFPFVARVVVDLGFGEGVVSIYARGMADEDGEKFGSLYALRGPGGRRRVQGVDSLLPQCFHHIHIGADVLE